MENREHGRQTIFGKENNGSSWCDLSDDRITNVEATNSVKIYHRLIVLQFLPEWTTTAVLRDQVRDLDVSDAVQGMKFS